MNTQTIDPVEQHARDDDEHRRRLRKFLVVGVDYVVPTILGMVTLAILLVDHRGFALSLFGAVAAIVIAGVVTRLFFVHTGRES